MSRKSWINEKLKNPRFRRKLEDEYIKLTISEQLVLLRLSSELTQAELAKRIGTTASAISRYERDGYDRYEMNTIRKIVEACGGEFQIIIKPKTA